MESTHRTGVSALVLVILAAFALLARWYTQHRSSATLASSALTLTVSSGADRGPGSLRDALFTADSAATAASIELRVPRITLHTALPPLVNPHGIRLRAAPGTELDARAVAAGAPVLDVDSEGTSIEGLTISGCPGTALLVRAPRFRLTASTISGCDVGVDVAGNTTKVALERDHFERDRIGVRFLAPSADSEVVKNRFDSNGNAGLWLVASQPTGGAAGAVSVHDNQFEADGTDIVVGNIPAVIERNDFTSVRSAAIHILGAGAVVRANHVAGGVATGILLENAQGAVIDSNDLEHLQGYAILVRGSADSVLRANRIHSCAYGIAFVLGNASHPNTAVGNELLDLRYDGIDVIGESPILRRNQVLQARAWPLHVSNFDSPDGAVVRARPLLERNHFELTAALPQEAR